MMNQVWIVTDLREHEVWAVFRTYEGAKEAVAALLREWGGDVWQEYVELGEDDEFPVDTFAIESYIVG